MFGRKKLGRHNRSLLASTCHTFKPRGVCVYTNTQESDLISGETKSTWRWRTWMTRPPPQRSHQSDFGCVHSSIAI